MLAGTIARRALGPFDRLEWWRLLEDQCGLKPLIVVAREGDDVAMLPLQAGRGHLFGLSNYYSFGMRPIISESAQVLPRPIELIAAIARDLRRRAWRVTLAPIPAEGWSMKELGEGFAAAGWAVECTQCDVNRYEALLYEDYAEYLECRPGPLRTTLKRKAGKVDVIIYEALAEEAWQAYEAVYRDSWKPEEGAIGFLRSFAEQEAAAGRLRLGIARHEGRPVAAQLWTVEAGTAYIHKLAYAEDAKPLSPGTTLTAALFKHVIDIDHVAMVDFGTGDDRYKADWLSDVRTRYRLDLFDKRSARAWPYIVRAALRRLAGRAARG